MNIKLDGITPFVGEHECKMLFPFLKECNKMLEDKSGAGNDFLGWLNLPEAYDKEEFARIKAAAQKIKKLGEILVVIGIGGSYLGARAAIEFVKGQHHNAKSGETEVYFVGNNISADYLNDILEIIGERDFCVNVISKSGTTTEPAIAFRIFKKLLEEKYGRNGAKERIFATTDKARGALKTLADSEHYESFVVPDDVGGRFSVLTAVGLLPMAVAGLDIESAMMGAFDAMKMSQSEKPNENLCLQYAAIRNCLLRKGRTTEVLVGYEPKFSMFGEWFKQLFAESEGKDGKGIFPVSANFTTDLHSIGQFIQDGSNTLFETVLWMNEPSCNYYVEETADDMDGLNYLAGRSMQYINSKAFEGTLQAHVDGHTPNIVIEFDRADEYSLGYLMYFFERSCGISGYLLGVNPFDQPGVEAYKKNMFRLLGKKGY